jgi:hypothetical protein
VHHSWRNAQPPAPAASAAAPERPTLEKRVSENLGITGLLMPAVLAGVLTGWLGWVLCFYAVFYCASCAAVILRLVLLAERR